MSEAGFYKRRIHSYVLFNYTDTPEDLFARVRDLLEWGITAYPMRYQPLSGPQAFDKDSYIATAWSPDALQMVAQARRVIGCGGAFPPYEGLVKKFRNARNFFEGFQLYQHKTKYRRIDHVSAADLGLMGQDHE